MSMCVRRYDSIALQPALQMLKDAVTAPHQQVPCAISDFESDDLNKIFRQSSASYIAVLDSHVELSEHKQL